MRLIVSPLMVVEQTVAECRRFFSDEMPIEIVSSGDLQEWLENGDGRLGITNYEAFKGDEGLRRGRLGALALDESSMLKSQLRALWASIIDLVAVCGGKIALTGTPPQNDRIEYANHAVSSINFQRSIRSLPATSLTAVRRRAYGIEAARTGTVLSFVVALVHLHEATRRRMDGTTTRQPYRRCTCILSTSN